MAIPVTIDSLPNEILIKVFVLYQPPRGSGISDAFERSTKPEWRDACTWAPLMGVCRHWRTVGLETPLLWRVVDVGKTTKRLELALVRTRDADLELYFHAYPTSVKALRMLAPHMHRVRKLLLPPMPLAMVSLLSSALSATFPVLNELQVRVNDPEEQRHADYVPFDLSPIRFPALRVLQLQTAVVPWTSVTMSRLWYLNLRSCSPPAEPRPSFAHFLDIIEACDELEELALHHFISRFAFPSPQNTTRTIHLPNLRKLVLGDVPGSIAHFVANVYIQETVTVRLEGWPAFIRDNLQGGFLSLLPRDSSRLRVLHELTEVWITLTLEDEQEIAAVIPRQSFPLTLSLESRRDYHWWLHHTRMLHQFTTMFHGIQLQTLRVFLGPNSLQRLATWWEVLVAFPTLQHLEVHPGGDPFPVFMALEMLDVPGGPLSVCPDLRRLEMDYYLDFSEQQPHIVLTALRRRAELGLPKLDYVRLRYKEDGARKMREALERDGTGLGHISDYVTRFVCSSSD